MVCVSILVFGSLSELLRRPHCDSRFCARTYDGFTSGHAIRNAARVTETPTVLPEETRARTLVILHAHVNRPTVPDREFYALKLKVPWTKTGGDTMRTMLPNGKFLLLSIPVEYKAGDSFVHYERTPVVIPDHFSEGLLGVASQLAADLRSCGQKYDMAMLVDNTSGLFDQQVVEHSIRADDKYQDILLREALNVPMNQVTSDMVLWFENATTFFNTFKLLSALLFLALDDTQRQLKILSPGSTSNRVKTRTLGSYDYVWSIESDVRV